jgi:phage gp36-like protein
MSLLTKADLKTHVYAEIIDEITRADDTLVQDGIDNGESEVKSYLNRYDIAVMFATSYTDKFLRSLVKDVVCWHIIKLCNANIQLELFRTLYQDAIKTFEKVMKGAIDPQWPLRANDPATSIDDAGNVEFRSECKRRNHY